MEIKGKVHCFFEQSGTFKNEFIKLGIPAEDYDIQNNFGETDHQDDLFKEIENAYDYKPSIFDNITKDDLIVAFFPCIYFSALSQMSMYWTCVNYRKKTMKEKTDLILERSHNREYFFSLAVKMLAVAQMRGLRLIMENPWSEQTFLKANFVMPPTLVDMDRTKRGDFFKKPTAYFFINCEPLDGETRQQSKVVKNILSSKSSGQAGLCSEDRSMISHDYARNWICDFILGIKQPNVDQNYGEALF
jgi:hypothetical protein